MNNYWAIRVLRRGRRVELRRRLGSLWVCRWIRRMGRLRGGITFGIRWRRRGMCRRRRRRRLYRGCRGNQNPSSYLPPTVQSQTPPRHQQRPMRPNPRSDQPNNSSSSLFQMSQINSSWPTKVSNMRSVLIMSRNLLNCRSFYVIMWTKWIRKEWSR